MSVIVKLTKQTVLFVGVAGAAFLVAPAHAASTNTSLNVSAAIPISCTASAVTHIAFGDLTVSKTAGSAVLTIDTKTVTGAIKVNCTNTGAYTVAADNGLNASGSQRRMRKGSTSAYINYNLNKTGGTPFPTSTPDSFTGTGLDQNIDVIGVIPAGTTTNEGGSFSDTVAFTVTY